MSLNIKPRNTEKEKKQWNGKVKCNNCGFIFRAKTVPNAWGELEVESNCLKCGSNSYLYIYEKINP